MRTTSTILNGKSSPKRVTDWILLLLQKKKNFFVFTLSHMSKATWKASIYNALQQSFLFILSSHCCHTLNTNVFKALNINGVDVMRWQQKNNSRRRVDISSTSCFSYCVGCYYKRASRHNKPFSSQPYCISKSNKDIFIHSTLCHCQRIFEKSYSKVPPT